MDFYGENGTNSASDEMNGKFNVQGGNNNSEVFAQTKGTEKIKKRKNKNAPLKVIALCLVCALIGGAVHPLYGMISKHGGETTIYTGSRTPTKIDVMAVDTEKEMTTAEIYSAYVGSTVGITVDIVTTNIWGQTVTGAAAGSGFVISQDGYILTNYHVIENANSIKVSFVDGTNYPAVLIGGEEDNDIAVIKIEADGLKPVVLGSSSDMLVGEQVTAIGNPLGELTFSETTGIISAKDRTVTVSEGKTINMIQTDCAINSGNSGGPLFNSHGEVIGIVSAKYSSSGSFASNTASIEGLGFAIPMDDVAEMVTDLVQNGYVTGKPLMGISVQNVAEQVQSYGVPAGAEVMLVTPGLSGDVAGLKEGDIITKFGDEEIDSASSLIQKKNEYKPGDKVSLTVYRSGETLELEITLEESTPERVEKQEQAQQEYAKKMQEQQKNQSGFNGGYFGFGY